LIKHQSKKLENIKVRLEKLMMNTKVKIDDCNNIGLLETLEEQITNTTRNLGLENSTKKRNELQTILPEKNIEVYYVFLTVLNLFINNYCIDKIFFPFVNAVNLVV